MTRDRFRTDPCDRDIGVLRTPLVDAAFLRSSWRARPRVFRDAVTDMLLQHAGPDLFFRWARAPVTGRLFMRTEMLAPGTSRAAPLRRVGEARSIWQRYRRRDALTILLNGIDRVDPTVTRLLREIGVTASWRFVDVVATLSTQSSGIGFHAGNEDGFIVQLAGRRAWTLWRRTSLPAAYAAGLLGASDAWRYPPPRPAARPWRVVELGPGDVLYLPPLTGHEGITLEESVSLSVAWKGVSFLDIITATSGMQRRDVLASCAASDLLRLFPDPTPSNSARLAREISTILSSVGVTRSPADLAAALRSLASPMHARWHPRHRRGRKRSPGVATPGKARRVVERRQLRGDDR